MKAASQGGCDALTGLTTTADRDNRYGYTKSITKTRLGKNPAASPRRHGTLRGRLIGRARIANDIITCYHVIVFLLTGGW
jgi:hypothetical protein